MLDNGTIAIWSVPRPNAQGSSLEAHFNYWRLAGDRSIKKDGKKVGRKRTHDLLEIGLLFDNLNDVESVKIFLPILLNASLVEDCAVHLAKPVFAQGIFNEVLSTTSNGPGATPCVILHDQQGTIFCRAHRFASTAAGIDPNELSIVPQNEGTLLMINKAAVLACSNVQPAAKSYFRLRIKLSPKEKENPFVKVILPLDRHWQSGYEEIEYIDFRMNEARTLPPPIETQMRADQAGRPGFHFKLVAFLTAVPVHSELSASSAPSHKMRLLEKNWDQYVGLELPSGMAVYHWKREQEFAAPVVGMQPVPIPITDFSAFVKLLTRRSNWTILGIYLAVAAVFGIAGNIVASKVDTYLTPAGGEAHLAPTGREGNNLPPHEKKARTSQGTALAEPRQLR
jgi:hypothetical protein